MAGGGRLQNCHLAHCQVSVCTSVSKCESEFDMQTPGRDFNHQNDHNFSGEYTDCVSCAVT